MRLNQPVVGMTHDSASGGYWLVAADGGIFAFDAPFCGSMGGNPLNRPVVGMATTRGGGGYWLVASDGGIFSFGNAAFYGSTGSIVLNRPIVEMAPDRATGGYWFVASDGGIFAFGAPFLGSAVAPAPPPPASPPSPPPAGAAPTCTVSLSNPNPAQYTDETATVQSNVANTTVTLTKYYKTVTSYDTGTTDGSGNATIPFYISGASIGFTVTVTATVGSASCSTSFTPV
jgi:hypothetical protein